jgi:hypothetical protein
MSGCSGTSLRRSPDGCYMVSVESGHDFPTRRFARIGHAELDRSTHMKHLAAPKHLRPGGNCR